MSVSGPSPLGTLMVQRVEAALGATLAQQANVATGARPDAVTQPGQPDKTDPAKNPPLKEQENARRAEGQGGRQAGLAVLARNDPEIAKLLAARSAPMTGYTASAPTTLGQAAKTILALLQQFPDVRSGVAGRAPLLAQPPGQGGSGAAGQGAAAGPGGAPHSAAPVGENLDPRAVEALMRRAGGGGGAQTAAASPGAAARAAASAAPGASHAAAGTSGQAGTGAPGLAAAGLTASGLPLPTGLAGQLALALSHAMQGSGLFYESHLRDFAFGRRTLAQMRGEPQAQAGRETPGGTASDSARARAGGDGTASSGSQASQTAQTNPHLAGALLGLDPSTHALVRQQLETLANQAFVWQGEAWPESKLKWEVHRRGSEDEHDGSTDNWATRLKLNLPGLGEIQARLSLSGSQLIMHLAAPDGASLMADHTGMLRERLNQQGLRLSQLTISRESIDDREERP